MSLTSYVTLGRSGLRVSPFTLGTMTFGEDLGWGSSPEESTKILAAYLDQGGNSVDTANVYTNGHAEVIVGDYLASRPGSATGSCSARSSSGTSVPAIRTAAAPAARRSSSSWRTRCAGCGPTTSTSTGCTTSIR